MKIKLLLPLALWILLAEMAGIIGSIFTAKNIPTWYASLIKPVFNPPAWLFGPVWTTLFLLMGIAAFLVWQKGWNRKDVKIALTVFCFQLVLNTFWSIIFFSIHSLGWAFIELVVLWLAILANIIVFAKISKPAAWLLLPYILWVSFAGLLNFSLWQLNSEPTSHQPISCTQEAKLCPDGSYVGRVGDKCEFAACPNTPSVPQGYSLDSYKVEKILDTACSSNNDCATPPEYLMRSSCPFTSLCLENKCAVVCPDYKPAK